MQIRYLKEIELKKSTRTKQPNGSYIEKYNTIGKYKVQFEEIYDEASVSIYGATVNRMYRISSPHQELEKYLKPKVSDENDNISKYVIAYKNSMYKISTVRKYWIDIEYKE